MLTISRLAVENLTGGCVTDEPHPVFSFSLDSDNQNVSVAEAILSVNGWECDTRQQTGIVYRGSVLQPLTAYTVSLAVTDNHGDQANKEIAFETGLMDLPWTGKWITDTSYRFTEKKISPKPMTFRRSFKLGRKPKRAQIFATALGTYELELNGSKVGEDYFAPGFTSYGHQLQYQVYDVTEQLQTENELLAVVGGGWAVGAYTYKRMNRLYADRQALLCELHLTYEDGKTEIIGTDENWHVTEDGRFQEAEFYNGETYDATIDYSKLDWRQTGLESLSISPRMVAQYGAPVRAHEALTPTSCTVSPSGVLIYDMGQNFAGVIRAKIKGKRGQKIIFSHAEILMDGELYTQPLRSAKQQAVYICVDGVQTYSPRMTYMGFRYVGVTGIQPEDLELEALALYSDTPDNGSFQCSNELLNKMQEAIRWGAKSNFVDIPTDCPQRDERLGWTGDIALFSPTAAWNFDTSRFFDKWLRDVEAEQTPGGGIPMIVPQVKISGQFEMLFPMAVDHWGDACILVPWAEYRARGDLEVLRRMYPTMKKYLKACKFWAELFSTGKNKRIWKLLFHYGDWCAPDTNYNGWLKRGKWTATACLAHSSGIVAQIARLLGEEKDTEVYARFSQETAEAYRTILMEPDCTIKNEFQTGYILPLHYGLLSGEDREKAAANLARLVRAGDWHIQTGFPGTPYALFALADNGYVEDAYKMLLTDTCPSWLYEVKTGGTTFWERWDALREDGTVNHGDDNGSGGMVSFNHYACGAVGDFLYRRIAGIEAVSGGYQEFRVAPVVGGGLTWAEGSVMTPYGKAVSKWNIEGTALTLTVTVPVGTRCQVVLPGGRTETVGSGTWTYEEELK